MGRQPTRDNGNGSCSGNPNSSAAPLPTPPRFAAIDNLEQLRDMGWTAEQPLRVVTGGGGAWG